jgi:hypothetical protein
MYVYILRIITSDTYISTYYIYEYFLEKFGYSAEHPCPAAASPMTGDALFFYVLFFTLQKIENKQKNCRSGAQTCDCHAKRTHAGTLGETHASHFFGEKK